MYQKKKKREHKISILLMHTLYTYTFNIIKCTGTIIYRTWAYKSHIAICIAPSEKWKIWMIFEKVNTWCTYIFHSFSNIYKAYNCTNIWPFRFITQTTYTFSLVYLISRFVFIIYNHVLVFYIYRCIYSIDSKLQNIY